MTKKKGKKKASKKVVDARSNALLEIAKRQQADAVEFTFLGSDDKPDPMTIYGISFKAGESVAVSDKDIIARLKANPQFALS